MTLLKAGILLWILAHGFRRFAPGTRARMGDKGKLLVTGLVLLSVVIMVIGYRTDEVFYFYDPPTWGRHANNLLMLIVFYLFAASGAKTRITRVIRNPQLTALVLWGGAHLLVNGEHSAVELFGGLAAWGVVMILLIRLNQPEWDPPAPPPVKKEITTAVIAVVAYVAVGFIHSLIGPWPFG